MAITNKQIEELQQRRLEIELQLKQHEAGMRRNSFGDYQKKYKKKKDVVKEIIKETPKKELTEVISEAAEEEPDVEYALTPKALELASKLSQTKSYQDMVSFSPTTTPIPNKIDPETQRSNNQKKQDKSKLKNKEPEFSSVAPTTERPVKVNDTVSDIFAKLFIFIRKSYIVHRKQKRDDIKYCKMIEKKKEIRIEELIKAFGGKIKGKKVKKETKSGALKMLTFGGLGLILLFKAKEVFASVPDFKEMLKKQLPSWMTGGDNDENKNVTVTTTDAGPGKLSGAAAITARYEVGYGTKGNLGPGATVKDSGGGYSYGYFGINSKGGENSPIASFVQENPQLGLKSQPGTPKFNEEWKQLAQVRGDELTAAQQNWYNKHVLLSAVSEYSKILPINIISDPRVQAYLADRRNQYGSSIDKPGVIANKDAKTPEEFIKRLSKYDSDRLEQNFPTALKTEELKGPGKREKFKQGLENRISGRESASLAVPNEISSSPEQKNAGPKLQPNTKQTSSVTQPTVEPNTKQTAAAIIPVESTVNQTTQSGAIISNVNNVVNKSTTVAVTQINKSDKPILLELSYG